MSIIEIPMMGGLGNQLFQFSYGQYLASQIGCSVRYSFLGLEQWSLKAIERKFSIEKLVKLHEHSKVNKPQIPLHKAISYFRSSYWITEGQLGEDLLPKISHRTRFISGYFQNYVYVAETWSELMKRFAEGGGAWKQMLSAEPRQEIAVHLRFGDYMESDHVRRFHGLTSPTYYRAAIQLLQDRLDVGRVRVVSDNPDVALKYIKEWRLGSDTEVIHSDGATDVEDLCEVSRAAGVVCSNSTFSWWGAYIGFRLRQVPVVVPTPWFSDVDREPRYLIPGEWTRLTRELVT